MLDARTRQNKPQRQENPALDGPVFPVAVPDFITVDKAHLFTMVESQIHPGPGRTRRWRGTALWLVLAEIHRQRCAPAIIADQLARACIWGQSPPRDWRRQLETIPGWETTIEQAAEPTTRRRQRPPQCPPGCPIREPHEHYNRCRPLGRLADLLVQSGGPDAQWPLDLDKKDDEGKPLRTKYKRDATPRNLREGMCTFATSLIAENLHQNLTRKRVVTKVVPVWEGKGNITAGAENANYQNNTELTTSAIALPPQGSQTPPLTQAHQ